MLTAGLGWEDFDARLAQEADFLSGLICILCVGCKRENFDLDACFLTFAQEFQKICDLFAAQCRTGNQNFPLRGLQIAFIDWCVGLRVENSASLLLLRRSRSRSGDKRAGAYGTYVPASARARRYSQK